jgi:hypothetical protein
MFKDFSTFSIRRKNTKILNLRAALKMNLVCDMTPFMPAMFINSTVKSEANSCQM